MRIFCPAIVCSLSLGVLRSRSVAVDPVGSRIGRTRAWDLSRARWHFDRRVPAAMLHHCSAVNPDAGAPGPAPCTHARTRQAGKDVGCCSAARGLGPCTRSPWRSVPPMHCPGSDPGHAGAAAGMWNLTSLRAARACRKPGRVARPDAQRSLSRTHRFEQVSSSFELDVRRAHVFTSTARVHVDCTGGMPQPGRPFDAKPFTRGTGEHAKHRPQDEASARRATDTTKAPRSRRGVGPSSVSCG